MEGIFEKIIELKKTGKSFVLATLVNTSESTPRNLGARIIILPDGKIFGTIGGGCLEKNVIRQAQKFLSEGEKKSVVIKYDLTVQKNSNRGIALGMLCGGYAEVMFETFIPSYDVVVCGGGHIGEKIASLCDILNMSYVIIDDRQEFADVKRFPNASKVICGNFTDELKKLDISKNTAIVIVTYGHFHDYDCLKIALKTPAYYIGMIGSRNKVKNIFSKLEKEKIKIGTNIYSPIGLDIGADTPAEIALSIMSEILAVRNKTSVRHLRVKSAAANGK